MNIELHLTDALRASDVIRWQIVRTLKDQSVAEHSFNVALIAMELAEIFGVDKGEVLHCAILHDLPEVLTGDIPTPTKEMMGRNRLLQFEKCVSFNGRGIHTFDPQVKFVVKMADKIDACLFLMNFGSGIHARKVLDSLESELRTGYPGAWELYSKIIDEPATTMDDVVNDQT